MQNTRVGTLTIGGVEYPAVINTRLLMELEDEGIAIDDILSSETRRWHNMVKLITLAINAGYRRVDHDKHPRQVSEDAVADALDIADYTQVTNDLAVLLGRAGRTVEAIPPKN